MPRSIVHVSAKLTMKTGCTMRTLRLKRALYVLWGESVPFDELRLVAALLAAFPGSRILSRNEWSAGRRQLESPCTGEWEAGRDPGRAERRRARQ